MLSTGWRARRDVPRPGDCADMKVMRRVLVGTAVVLATTLLASCGLIGWCPPLKVGPGSIAPVPARRCADHGRSKDFTEQVILATSSSSHCPRPCRRPRPDEHPWLHSTRDAQCGTDRCQLRIHRHGLDQLPRARRPIPDSRHSSKPSGTRISSARMVWTDPAPMNNTYALATSRATAERTGCGRCPTTPPWWSGIRPRRRRASRPSSTSARTASRHGGRRTDSTRASRSADPADRHHLPGDRGRQPVQVRRVFTTDGRIAALDLVVLEDDRQFSRSTTRR